ncbi:MAG: type I restriction enzyme HsdR N-terminal domain-containing protein [Bifidobacteriaceae bacterium]|nr:type I restriction enzyme HsdR N-terminal domain-containing protein [Bifidobacteriaceae bacterium]
MGDFKPHNNNSNIRFKTFNQDKNNEFKLGIDFDQNEFIYPKDQNQMKIHRDTITNLEFDKKGNFSENFVVFECIHRLFELGYEPKHIELETQKSQGLGKGKNLGWCDIFVFDNQNNTFMLVECKKPGIEFEKAWNKTQESGAQLFSYVEDRAIGRGDKRYFPTCVLYTSEFANDNKNGNELIRNYKAINLKDNDEYLKQSGLSLAYKNANNSGDLFNTWKKTYGQDFTTMGIFEDGITRFEIGKKKFTFSDIQNNKIYDMPIIHQFRTILRKYSVGSGENAFDKLLNLLLCKIVDEINSEITGEELEFYWKGAAFDDKLSLVDRLQKLYNKGMEDYLNEPVTYIERNAITEAFKLFKTDPDATKDTINQYFTELKYYANNYFAFIDVHNKKNFDDNFKILMEIVSLWQDISLTDDKQHQTLGDLFERLLDQGVKQSEGQFFTPLPIVRFLTCSLPLKEKLQNKNIPKMLDFACGSGHFLNEYAEQIKKIRSLEANDIKKYPQNITGIEKESRLAKVSKISSLMYGQNDIEIKYQDALCESEQKYDILLANPPFSVEDFLETLPDKEKNSFELYKFINNTSSFKKIEYFFVELTDKLLKAQAVAAIILPLSILGDSSKIGIKTREILFKNFDILAIFISGGETFSKTSTNTSTLFLRKKDNKPNSFSHAKNRADNWFSDDKKKDRIFEDIHIKNEFLKIIEKDDISKLTEIEKDKFTYYYLLYSQENPVIIVKSPEKEKSLKEFLGYEWSTRKGFEGINYLQEGGISEIKTPLFDPDNLFNETGKINGLIRENFLNSDELKISESMNKFVSIHKLKDLIDFKKEKFTKEILLKPITNLQINWQLNYKLVRLGDYIKHQKEFKKSLSKNKIKKIIKTESKQVKLLPSSSDYDWWTDDSVDKEIINNGKVITFGFARYANIKYYEGEYISSHNYLIESNNEQKLKTRYIYILLHNKTKEFYVAGQQYPKLEKLALENLKIPLPPIKVQNELIKEFDNKEKEIIETKNKITELQNNRDNTINKAQTRGGGDIGYPTNLFLNLLLGHELQVLKIQKTDYILYILQMYLPLLGTSTNLTQK